MFRLAWVALIASALAFGAHAKMPEPWWLMELSSGCTRVDNPSHLVCDPAAVAANLRKLSEIRPTNDADESDFLSLCENAVSAMLSVRAQVVADNEELASVRCDHPTEDERREILRTFERAERHAEAYLDGMRSMAASWCPNVSGFRGAIADSERDMKQIKETIDSMRRAVPGAGAPGREKTALAYQRKTELWTARHREVVARRSQRGALLPSVPRKLPEDQFVAKARRHRFKVREKLRLQCGAVFRVSRGRLCRFLKKRLTVPPDHLKPLASRRRKEESRFVDGYKAPRHNR